MRIAEYTLYAHKSGQNSRLWALNQTLLQMLTMDVDYGEAEDPNPSSSFYFSWKGSGSVIFFNDFLLLSFASDIQVGSGSGKNKSESSAMVLSRLFLP